ncbi:hypothetical protein HWQ46_14640 [Shewanella sp. D64]|uniref:hypothetical protein n=1 Tax=unclassified Shewanella TaxID=196818 RepID=UPI0022BA6AFB|nr:MULTISPECIES: hypothetical protein [unclassified Shewanella]MEC4726789.1 hypothetical protein [Shewanella sp. D64]MEC4739099.1 hypothetical protein [Shewanella sp. E94]WBJ95955.1 hypothetical protein HWQ47_02115 [Shewanella sp. MTB7]
MSKKLERKITKNFDKAFNFGHFMSQNPLNTEPVGRDFLNQFVSEVVRLSSLSIPLTTDHIENVDGIPTPVEYPTHFKNIINQLKCIQFLHECLEQLQNTLINFPQESEIILNDIKALNNLHETSAQAMFQLGILVGAHNQEMNSSYYTEAGITKLQSDQRKLDVRYNNAYVNALILTQKILSHFYSIESNHPYKPNLVIDHIEMLCLKKGIDYPKDRKSEIFKDLIDSFLKPITPHKNWEGSTKNIYKHIDTKNFQREYKPFIEKLMKK